MVKIQYDLLTMQKSRKHNSKGEIDLFPYATELYEELEQIGIIDRLKEIPQLGAIKVRKKLAKTRYDYIVLQLYLHQMIKNPLQGELRWTYNSYVAANEFRRDYKYVSKEKPTIADIIQLLTIVYNIGHFYNTFTASRAVTMLASEDSSFFDMVEHASNNMCYQKAAQMLLRDKNYQRLHLLNSILILEQCDQTKQSITLAIEILYAYINESTLANDGKLKYAFNIFRCVRDVSYMAYDLQISETPLMIDLCNEKAMILLFKERLSEYNNNQSLIDLFQSAAKLLDDTIYNENSNAICFYKISRRMVSSLKKELAFHKIDYYKDLFADKNSLINREYTRPRDYNQTHILKLTFPAGQRLLFESFLTAIERINNTRVGYYNRLHGEQTILVSIKKNCDSSIKRYTALRVIKCAVRYLRKIPGIRSTDTRFILCAKFFLFYLFNEHPIVIKPTISAEKCVICTRGKNTRINEINALLHNSCGTEDADHEVKFLLSHLTNDQINDTSLTIPASILVYEKNAGSKELCEFDGMIIHPMRKSNQIFFLEAKNRKRKNSEGKKCLMVKMDKLSLQYDEDEIHIVAHDAYMKYTV